MFDNWGDFNSKREVILIVFIFILGSVLLIGADFAKDYEAYTIRVVGGFILWIVDCILLVGIGLDNVIRRIKKLEDSQQ